MTRLVLLAIATGLAADAPLPPKRTGLEPPPVYSLKRLNTKPPAGDDAERRPSQADPGKPMQAGVHRTLDSGVIAKGRWETLKDGSGLWRLAIRSPGAAAVRLHFRRFNVGAGRVWIYSPNAKDAAGPFTALGPNRDGDFWTGVLASDTVIVDYQPAGKTARTIPFTLTELSHLWGA